MSQPIEENLLTFKASHTDRLRSAETLQGGFYIMCFCYGTLGLAHACQVFSSGAMSSSWLAFQVPNSYFFVRTYGHALSNAQGCRI